MIDLYWRYGCVFGKINSLKPGMKFGIEEVKVDLKANICVILYIIPSLKFLLCQILNTKSLKPDPFKILPAAHIYH